MSTLPATYDVCLKRGDTWRNTFIVKDDNGVVIDLTGYTFFVQVRRVADDPETPLLDLSIGNGLTVTAVDGQIDLVAQTESLDAGDYVWDLQANNGSIVETLLAGAWQLVQDVTRPSP